MLNLCGVISIPKSIYIKKILNNQRIKTITNSSKTIENLINKNNNTHIEFKAGCVWN